MNKHEQLDWLESEELVQINNILCPDFVGQYLPENNSDWNEDKMFYTFQMRFKLDTESVVGQKFHSGQCVVPYF